MSAKRKKPPREVVLRERLDTRIKDHASAAKQRAEHHVAFLTEWHSLSYDKVKTHYERALENKKAEQKTRSRLRRALREYERLVEPCGAPPLSPRSKPARLLKQARTQAGVRP